MTNKVNPIPQGHHTLTPYLVIDNAADALEFYKKAFNAEALFVMPRADGKIGHAEFKIGDSILMLAEECAENGYKSIQAIGNSPVSLHLYVENVDALFKQAIKAGAKEMRPVQDQFYGDRLGALQDPFGFTWTVATHIEDVSMEEIQRRMQNTAKA